MCGPFCGSWWPRREGRETASAAPKLSGSGSADTDPQVRAAVRPETAVALDVARGRERCRGPSP
ncbi:hypothetical protein SXIM_01200 [Streptomyces xiamenensis]|uniref:Uncharacterized protein n=1 Tax=Streptomyces xiamenensis TaxID=408015 RepID=A0A0F7FP36_9ACTN|nr:hypothetical protein SXIM_01200 [Streptomyces xiamenensis]